MCHRAFQTSGQKARAFITLLIALCIIFQGKFLRQLHSTQTTNTYIPNHSAELLFDIEFFSIDPEPFYTFAPNLIPNFKLKQLGFYSRKEKNTSCPPSTDSDESSSSSDDAFPVSNAHKFMKMMNEKKKLLRNYSQNIDGLELLWDYLEEF